MCLELCFSVSQVELDYENQEAVGESLRPDTAFAKELVEKLMANGKSLQPIYIVNSLSTAFLLGLYVNARSGDPFKNIQARMTNEKHVALYGANCWWKQ